MWQCHVIIISTKKDRNELNCFDNNLLFKLIKITGMLQLTISGDSMIPSLYEGDLVDVVSQNNYCIGDILVFKYGENRIVAHRLIDRIIVFKDGSIVEMGKHEDLMKKKDFMRKCLKNNLKII